LINFYIDYRAPVKSTIMVMPFGLTVPF